MFQVEHRFERRMVNMGKQEPPIRHYPIAEVVAGHAVWHIMGLQPIQQLDGHVYKRRTHILVTKAGIAAELLAQNNFEDVSVFVAVPSLLENASIPKIHRCTAIWECFDKTDRLQKGWGCDLAGEPFVDPTDEIKAENVEKTRVLWRA